jgi:hypothetical protein
MKKLILILGLVTASLFGAVLFDSQTAYAATGEVIDRSTIKIGEQVFFDDDMDATFRYEEAGSSDNCPDKIDGFSNDSDFTPGNTPADATLTIRTGTAGSSNCSERKESVTFGSSRSNFLKAFVWVDENTIQGSDGKLTFIRNGTSNIFVSDKEYSSDNGSVSCSDTLTISANNQALALIERKGRQIANHDYDWYPFRPGSRVQNDETRCWEAPVINGLAISGSPQGGNEGGAPGAGNSGAGAENQPSCESEGRELSWILCPILYLTDNIVEELDETIANVLQVPNEYLDNPALKDTWARLRNIAYLILLPAFLVMVISTALGFELISAYTVKKALPRLIAATMFIALSWEITRFFVIFINDIGSGMSGLITSSFGEGANITLASIMKPNNSDSVATAGIFSGLVVATVAVTSIGIILSYAFVTVIALLIGFIALSLRQMLIVALMLLAPLAILAWIFPGNDKMWKLWKESFTKLLLLYPLIAILIASGKVFASIVSDIEGSLIGTFIKLVAYIGPYFFIPTAFKLAGGLFATVAGMANDRGRGLFDRQRKYRTDTRASLRERAGSNNRFNPNNKLVRRLRLNNMASWGADPMSNIAYSGRNIPGLSGKGQRIKSAIEGSVSDQSGKLFEELNNKYKFNDKAFRALSGSHSGFSESTQTALREAGMYGKAPTSLQDFQRMSSILSRSSDATEQVAANVLGAASGRLTSLYTDPEMGKASTQAAGITGLSAHGFADGKDLAYVGNDMTGKGMSSDLAQAIVSGAQVAGQRQRPDIKAGYGTVFKDGKFIDGMSSEGGRARKLIKTLSSADLASAKGGALETLTPTIKEMLSEGGDEALAVKDQLFSWAGPYSQASVGVKAQALDIIRGSGLQNEFESRRRADETTDPQRRGLGGAGSSGDSEGE